MNGEGYIRIWRNEKLTYLIGENHSALALLLLIMFRARWSDAWNSEGLAKGQCKLGKNDVERSAGLSAKEYRTAKKHLERIGAVKFEKGTSQGATRSETTYTIATLTNEVFCGDLGNLQDIDKGTPSGKPGANQGQTGGKPGAPNVDRLDSLNGKNDEDGSARGAVSSSSSAADSVSEIPDTFSLPGVEELGDLKGCVAAVVGLNPKWGEVRKVQVIENALKGCSASVRAKAVHDFLSENVVQGSTKDVFPRNWFRQFMERAERERLNIGETSGPRGNFVGAYQ